MNDAFFIKTPIISRNHTNQDIICNDQDGDGFFYWGIGAEAPSTLPEWAESLKDGDDSNPLKGSINQYGYLGDILYDEPYTFTFNITDDNLYSYYNSRIMRNDIIIGNGCTLTINHCLAFHLEKTLTLQNGSTLKIHGGHLYNPTINAQPGSTIIIENGLRPFSFF